MVVRALLPYVRTYYRDEGLKITLDNVKKKKKTKKRTRTRVGDYTRKSAMYSRSSLNTYYSVFFFIILFYGTFTCAKFTGASVCKSEALQKGRRNTILKSCNPCLPAWGRHGYTYRAFKLKFPNTLVTL